MQVADVFTRLSILTVTVFVIVFSLPGISDAGNPAGAGRYKGRDFTQIPPGARYVTDEVIVMFAPQADGQLPAAAAKQELLSSLAKCRILLEPSVLKSPPQFGLAKLPAGLTVADALKMFNGKDGIIYAQPHYIYEQAAVAEPQIFPNDHYISPAINRLWGLHNTGQKGGNADADIDAPEAWYHFTRGEDVIVAVLCFVQSRG